MGGADQIPGDDLAGGDIGDGHRSEQISEGVRRACNALALDLDEQLSPQRIGARYGSSSDGSRHLSRLAGCRVESPVMRISKVPRPQLVVATRRGSWRRPIRWSTKTISDEGALNVRESVAVPSPPAARRAWGQAPAPPVVGRPRSVRRCR